MLFIDMDKDDGVSCLVTSASLPMCCRFSCFTERKKERFLLQLYFTSVWLVKVSSSVTPPSKQHNGINDFCYLASTPSPLEEGSDRMERGDGGSLQSCFPLSTLDLEDRVVPEQTSVVASKRCSQ